MRCFIAFFPDKEVINFLKKKLYMFKSHSELLKMVSLYNMHITLIFLGEVDREREYGKVNSVVSEVVRRYSAFSYELGEFGAFPNLSYPKVFWFSVLSEEMKKLQQDIKNGLLQNGFSLEDKNFIPHITIARVKRYAKSLKKLSDALEYENRKLIKSKHIFDKVSIVESILTPKGPIYKVRDEFRLKE